MKTKLTVTLLALGIALPVVSLNAQDTSDRPTREGRGPRGDRPIPGVFGALDANNDRKLDKAEIAAAKDALKKLDKDNDGKLTMAELRGGQGRGPRSEAGEGERPNREQRAQSGQRNQSEERAGERPRGEGAGGRMMGGGSLVTALDTNKDGTLDTEELKVASAALAKLDKNTDGELTMEELQVVRGNPGARRGDGERPNGEGRGNPNRGESKAESQP